jgi:23S rRNA (cytosine1962-C5)-methyltransferase
LTIRATFVKAPERNGAYALRLSRIWALFPMPDPPQLPETDRPRLKLVLRPAAESAVRGGHPWIYAESIREQSREGEAGELAVVYDRRDRFLAVGLYDPDSPLRVRVVHVGAPRRIGGEWWRTRLEDSLARREGLADARTDGLRLVNGESDGWPGLVLDRYADTLVLKLYSAVWLPRLGEVAALVDGRLAPARLVLRLARKLSTKAGELGLADGQILRGELPDGPVVFLESGLRFEADVLRGQKTGFFLDQRENRRRVEALARGAEVLNAFSFSGGFSLYAARGGAKSVTDLDLSAHALAAARRNFDLNRDDAAVSACVHRTEQADAFAWLGRAAPASFDLVVVDPPSLAKREGERAGAIRAYRRLNADAIRLLRRGGLLVAASCSAHVSESEFFGAVREAARASGRRVEEVAAGGHAPDHPASFAEARYLKCLFLRFR